MFYEEDIENHQQHAIGYQNVSRTSDDSEKQATIKSIAINMDTMTYNIVIEDGRHTWYIYPNPCINSVEDQEIIQSTNDINDALGTQYVSDADTQSNSTGKTSGKGVIHVVLQKQLF